ncbi:MAG TPA: YfhL family 4Fe-4S dicluster ferredoxin [Candidatus Acidoferrales bacterium]|nr:YfhL family 4Fe-4S dicluster ferredoxin [Candidatus Acidoferrales bacterium]
MITNDCINCGACEPECPNNAISQGENLYVIDPLLCTECVGFHDYEACAAVCPVDCCVTDPNNIETEEALIARARALHPEVNFGEQFESRFRKGAGKPATSGAAKKPEPAAAAAARSEAPPAAAADRQPGPAPEEDLQALLAKLPEVDEWQIPVRCFRCGQSYEVPAERFMIGNVLFCPHCFKSMVVKDSLSFQIRTTLKQAYEKWQKARAELEAKRARELKEFYEKRARELEAFIDSERRSIEQVKDQLRAITETYDAPGRIKKGNLLGWG